MIKMYFKYAAYTSLIGLLLLGGMAYGVFQVLFNGI